MKKVIYITGPTASGKTDLAVSLSKELNTEVLGADSMQIYKYITVGTAKPTPEELQGQKYHFIDFVEPDEIYTVSEFKDDALKEINRLHLENKVPIVCGGTGLYVNSLLYKMDFTASGYDLELRKKLDAKTDEELVKELEQVDFESYKNIDLKNRRRVTRALEIYYLTNKTKSSQVYNYKEHPRDYDHKLFIIDMDRDVLYDRINRRVDIMIDNGLVSEVEFLIDKYKDTSKPIFQFIGYKEIVEYLNKEVSLETAIDNVKKNTRHFAKRQITWFKGITGIKDTVWLKPDTKENMLDKIIELSKEDR